MSKYSRQDPRSPVNPVKKLSDCINQFLNTEEVKIVGRISCLYFQGKLLYPNPDENENEPVKKKNKSYIIVPVKNRDNCVEFIKIPICKAEKGVKAKNIGNVKIQRLKSDGCETTETLPLWVAEKSAIPLFDKSRFPRGGTNSVEFVYKRESAPPPKKEESGCSKKFRCRRKTKGTPPKDKKKDKPKRKKSRTDDKEC